MVLKSLMIIKNNVFFKFILLILAVFFALISAEILCRFFYHYPRYLTLQDTFCEYDPLLGWRHKTNTTVPRRTKEYSIKESFNSRGIRGPEYSYDKNKDSFRILILGDSFAEGYGVEFEELFSQRLKSELAGKGINCEVINSGTQGYSTDQELIFFKTEGVKYKPDLTVLLFYDNDIWYNNQYEYRPGSRRGYYKPLFKLKDGKLVLTDTPVFNFGRWLNDRSYFFNFIHSRLNNNLIPGEYRIYEKKQSVGVREAWKITETLIAELKKSTDAFGSRLLIVYVPNRESVYVEEQKEMKSKYRIANKDWDMEQGGAALENICARSNINFVNFTGLFKEKAAVLRGKNQRLYFEKDLHWNTLGHKFAGELLGDYVYDIYKQGQ